MGKHSEKSASSKFSWPKAKQVAKDTADPKYDQPKTFGKGWFR